MMQENFTINCEICDARKIKEENYKAYSQIMLNTDILLVNETSKEILRLSMLILPLKSPMICLSISSMEILS